MKNYLLKSLLLSTLIIAAIGCSKEQVAGTPKTEKYVANNVEVFQNLTCANHTLIKPPVDILYVVDNSLSSGYIADAVKSSIQQTIQTISTQFDFHVMVAPLIAHSSSENLTAFPVITNNASGMDPSVNVISLENLTFFSTTAGINSEAGFDRVVQVINANRSNGVFRNQAHTIVALVSNGNDTPTTFCSQFGGCGAQNSSAFNQRYNNLITLKGQLQAQQFRFFSMVAHCASGSGVSCPSGYLDGSRYREMSVRIYNSNAASDQQGRSTPDSYSILDNSYATTYEGVNRSIQQEILGHTYNRWQISTSTNPNLDLNDVQVFKLSSSGASTPVPQSGTNGFTCCSYGTFPTRELPTVGETATGTFIDLFGSGKVVYPECLVVKTRTPTEFYGFAVVPTKPKPETIVVRIRGANIPQNGTNGWTYVGYRENQNIKVNSNGTPNTTSPLLRTGYFIQLHGSAIYSSGDSVEVFYTPAPL